MPPALDEMLGPERAAQIIKDFARDLAHRDGLPENIALRLACERATDGDPLLLAAPGQVWTLRPDADPDDAPARRLTIYGRLEAPPRILVLADDNLPGGTDAAADTGDEDEGEDGIPLSVLDRYQLQHWSPASAAGSRRSGDGLR
ncbi:hypothetical protein V1L54_27220 [Streptomyces sp. TRM 70361]|uniref:hypothetical protein n=1 Tax=Streptomyces sp. TRM 70361 TaxID=3116553 RepID=UPI002E7C1CCD|nr:hypothetical protein [Streptomyces sp. TRM 70361]MEE1943052.1 hypothetical protein [Streptomyces sp. TRM 70361]